MRTTKIFFPILFALILTFALVGGLALTSSAIAAPDAPTATTRYVDADATGAASGADWTDAYTSVQDALAAAISGDEIWVAEGVYYPDEGVGQTDDMITSTFVLTDGVALYGGFAATETLRTQRDWEANVTVLSGDIDHETNPDSTDPHGVVTTTANIAGENAYHVVSSSGVIETALIDGFNITAGQADGSYVHPCGPTCGGGMYNQSSSPTLTNLIFSGNSAEYGGGMINCVSSSPVLTNVIFSGNSTVNGGGGMANNGSSSPALSNVTFSGNSTEGHGGGMYNHSSSNPTLSNVTFSGNSANDGGGMSNRDSSSPTLSNTILWGNTAAARITTIISTPIRFSCGIPTPAWMGPGMA